MANSDQPGSPESLCFAELCVGQRFISGAHLIDEEQIKAFAKQFDPQPFHLDADAAKNTLFEGLVASGWQTVAISMRLLVESGLRAGLSASAQKVPGQSRHDRALSFVSRAKSSN